MSEYKNGDTVRVVLEGRVTDLDTYGNFDLRGQDENGLFIEPLADLTIKSIKVVASPLKVGDLVEGKQYDLLPVGTVVHGIHGALWRLDDGHWVNARGQHFTEHGLQMPRAIQYLPE